jgi:CRISPR-associated endonuclease/helicase Cas3
MSQTVQTHRHLWAKSADKSAGISGDGESLLQHSVNITTVARRLCRQLPFPESERADYEEVLLQATAFHDLGKAATGFQRMLREGRKALWKHRHETLSTVLAYKLNPQLDPCALFAVLTHHQSIPNDGISGEGEKCLPPTELPPDFGGLMESKDWQQMLAELRVNWESLRDVVERLSRVLKRPLAELSPDTPLSELGIEPVWLDRSARKQRRIPDEQKWRASLLRGLLITSDHLASAIDPRTRAHPKPLAVPRLADYSEMIKEKELPKGMSLLPFQQRTANTEGDAILKAPTGSGKTLAALLWAARNQVENGRFFYVLPYTASINAMADRLKRIFDAKVSVEDRRRKVDDSLVGVLHHRNADYLFRSMENEESAQQRNKSARHLSSLAREMYHPIRVCTPHQILRFALCGRGWETGLSEFPRACFVFDEVHAFEPLLAGLTLATVRLLKRINARILFASATIPRFLEEIIKSKIGMSDLDVIAPDPNDELDAAVCGKVRHRIEVRNGSLLDNLPLIVDEIHASGETALIVCNHVATSQQVFEQLRNEFHAMLLHSRFNGEDRNRIEKAITSKEKPTVLVGTQAIEVSLDIDYDRGYTEPAPADALGQRFGRINRKGNRPQPTPVVVFSEPSAGYLYDQTLTDRTVELLSGVGELTEAELTDVVDQVYEQGYPPNAMEDFNNGNGNSHINNFESEIVAGTYRRWTDDIIDQTDGQVDVLPDSLLAEYIARRDEKLFIAAAQLLVPIRAGQKFKALKMNALRRDENLREYVTSLTYDSEIGLKSDERSSNIF